MLCCWGEERWGEAIHQDGLKQLWVLLTIQAAEPSALPRSKRAHQRLVDCRRAGALPEVDLRGKQCWCLKREASRLRDVCFSFPPHGPAASVWMPQSTQSRTHHSCMVSIMDHANALVCSNRENNNVGFIFTKVSVVRVSTKQMSSTLQRSKSRPTNRGLPFPYNTSEWASNWTVRCLFHLFLNLLPVSVHKVKHTTYIYHQTLISQGR